MPLDLLWLGQSLLLSASSLSGAPLEPPAAVLADPVAPLAAPVPRAARAEDDGPWRLAEALGLPDWFDLAVQQRTRYESLDEEFRAGKTGSNQLWAFRTRVQATVHYDAWRASAEMLDSRVLDFPTDATLNTGIINAVELLQAFVGYGATDVFEEGDQVDVQVGRQTLDVGSRRLVARNRFRNTINAFTGASALWTGSEGEEVRAFAFFPVRREPADNDALRDNELEFDEEQTDTIFWGLEGNMPILGGRAVAQAYLLGINEDDEDSIATRDRRLLTLGGRIDKEPASQDWFYEWESALQFGESRSSGSSTEDLDHFAQFHHLSGGYRWEGDTKPTVEFLLDFASGDQDPDDDENNRFDTLFGARRFEYGPTGIFGAFARSNIVSPGVRFTNNPVPRTGLMLAHRFHWLASDQDALTTGQGLGDPTGDTGSFAGHLAEIRVRHTVIPGNLNLEAGFAHLFAGDVIEDSPNAVGGDDVNYVYFTVTWTG